MNKARQPSRLPRENPFSRWLRTPYRRRIRAVFPLFLRLSCWSGIAWIVWNHALATFLNADGIGFWQALGIGAILSALSIIFEDSESPSGTEIFHEPKAPHPHH